MENWIFFSIKISTRPGCLFLTKLIYGSCCAEPNLLLTVTWLWGGFSALSMVEQAPLHYTDLGLAIALFFPHSRESVFDCSSNGRCSSYSHLCQHLGCKNSNALLLVQLVFPWWLPRPLSFLFGLLMWNLSWSLCTVVFLHSNRNIGIFIRDRDWKMVH